MTLKMPLKALNAGLLVGGLLVGAVYALSCIQTWTSAAPTPVPCYDFLDASANVIVLFNKCTGAIEVRRIAPPSSAPDGSGREGRGGGDVGFWPFPLTTTTSSPTTTTTLLRPSREPLCGTSLWYPFNLCTQECSL